MYRSSACRVCCNSETMLCAHYYFHFSSKTHTACYLGPDIELLPAQIVSSTEGSMFPMPQAGVNQDIQYTEMEALDNSSIT